MSDEAILRWLKDVSTDKSSPAHPRKRRHPMTPDLSEASAMSSPNNSPKRQYYQTTDDETPRPNKRRVLLPDSTSLSSEHSSKSTTSGRSSPRKQLRYLEMSDGGIRVQDLAGLRTTSTELHSLLKNMRAISRGRGVICDSIRAEIEAHAKPLVAEIAEDESCFSQQRARLGLTPSLNSVLEVLEAAVECSQNLHAEPDWNMEVHYQVLRLALRPPHQPAFSNFINFTPCPTAALISELLSALLPSKKIDFCFYINPEHESLPSEQEDRSIPCRYNAAPVNPTDYYPLRRKPLALCIETKKPGEGWEGATLQMGVWQAAQWNVLRNSLFEGTYPQIAAGGTDDSRMPQFLPGMIIQGHDWYLVVTTRDATQTVLWNKLLVGSTNSVLGIYQIICALQHLRQWCKETYWPHIRRIVEND